MSLKQILRAVSPVERSQADRKFHDTNWTRYCLLSPSQQRTLMLGTVDEAAALLDDLRTRARLTKVDLTPDEEFLNELRNSQT